MSLFSSWAEGDVGIGREVTSQALRSCRLGESAWEMTQGSSGRGF